MEESSSVNLQEQPRTSYEGLIQHLKKENRDVRNILRKVLEIIIEERIESREDIERAANYVRIYWPNIQKIKEAYRNRDVYSKEHEEQTHGV